MNGFLAVLGWMAYSVGCFAATALLLAVLVTVVPAFHPGRRLDCVGRPFRNFYAVPLLRLITGRRAPDRARIKALERETRRLRGL